MIIAHTNFDGSDQTLDAESRIKRLVRDLKDCRNELCLKCGEYKQRHLGACDGCRWKEVGQDC